MFGRPTVSVFFWKIRAGSSFLKKHDFSGILKLFYLVGVNDLPDLKRYRFLSALSVFLSLAHSPHSSQDPSVSEQKRGSWGGGGVSIYMYAL